MTVAATPVVPAAAPAVKPVEQVVAKPLIPANPAAAALADVLPNRMYLHSAQSGGLTQNVLPEPGGIGWPSLWHRLEDAGVDWAYYYSDLPFVPLFKDLAVDGHVRRLMNDLIVKAGVPRITPKGLRHTAQSVGRVVVGDDKVMQERLGHSDVEITFNTYTHTVTEQHRKAGEQLDEIFRV